jgi:hypothetical protein
MLAYFPQIISFLDAKLDLDIDDHAKMAVHLLQLE